MLHKHTDVIAQSMPGSPNARLFVIRAAVAVTVAESRTTWSHASACSSSVAALYRDNCVTLWVMSGAVGRNAWLNVTETYIFVRWPSRHARVSVYHHRRRAVSYQIPVAKVVVARSQSIVTFHTVNAWKFLIGVRKVPYSQCSLVQIKRGGKGVTILNGRGIHLGVASNRFTRSFIWQNNISSVRCMDARLSHAPDFTESLRKHRLGLVPSKCFRSLFLALTTGRQFFARFSKQFTISPS